MHVSLEWDTLTEKHVQLYLIASAWIRFYQLIKYNLLPTARQSVGDKWTVLETLVSPLKLQAYLHSAPKSHIQYVSRQAVSTAVLTTIIQFMKSWLNLFLILKGWLLDCCCCLTPPVWRSYQQLHVSVCFTVTPGVVINIQARECTAQGRRTSHWKTAHICSWPTWRELGCQCSPNYKLTCRSSRNYCTWSCYCSCVFFLKYKHLHTDHLVHRESFLCTNPIVVVRLLRLFLATFLRSQWKTAQHLFHMIRDLLKWKFSRHIYSIVQGNNYP